MPCQGWSRAADLRPEPLPQARINHWLVGGSNARGDLAMEPRTLLIGHCKLKWGGPFAKSVSSFSLGRFSLSQKEEGTWSQWASGFRFPRPAPDLLLSFVRICVLISAKVGHHLVNDERAHRTALGFQRHLCSGVRESRGWPWPGAGLFAAHPRFV